MEKAKAIMVQGTMSNVGKSLLAAGLCRVFKQDGYKVAPFKAQNMALNSFITEEGLEMGRAQVMQAECAGIKPDVRMNPILLKPTNDVGSQVIVNGEVLGNMKARDYFDFKKNLVPDVKRAYDALAAEYDIIVIEGAGSPAEINLKDQDYFVNMDMAKIASAPVLIVGDIDRGGVFAQLIGTVKLLTEEEQSMVKGLVINKFRGDKSILDPGIIMLEEMAAIPVVGTVPYVHLKVDDEDSLSERFEHMEAQAPIDFAVIRVPRISNFTDFNTFESIDGVSLRYVTHPSELGEPDVIFMPGSKDTIGDLLWLRQSGMEAAIKKKAANGTIIFGICGGYQMLGNSIEDASGVEHREAVRGMQLLPIDTVFEEEKTRTQVEGTFVDLPGNFSELSGKIFHGYEIHMGQSTITAPKERALKEASAETKEILPSTGEAPVRKEKIKQYMTILRGAQIKGEKPDGCFTDHVFGTYVHGIFDDQAVSEGFVRAVAKHKGLDPDAIHSVDYNAFKETQYDILADAVRENMDMQRIYEILDRGL